MEVSPRPDRPEQGPEDLWQEALWGVGMVASVLLLVALIAATMR
jgi:hypothetical protein